MGFDSDNNDRSKYDGFKVYWDKDLNTFVFDSKDERDRWQIQQYGHVRNAFREPEEPTDERRGTRLQTTPDWTWEEESRYLKAFRALPLSEYGSLTMYQFLSAVAEVAEGIKPKPAVKDMPKGE